VKISPTGLSFGLPFPSGSFAFGVFNPARLPHLPARCYYVYDSVAMAGDDLLAKALATFHAALSRQQPITAHCRLGTETGGSVLRPYEELSRLTTAQTQ
jgi:hypothetical protein